MLRCGEGTASPLKPHLQLVGSASKLHDPGASASGTSVTSGDWARGQRLRLRLCVQRARRSGLQAGP